MKYLLPILVLVFAVGLLVVHVGAQQTLAQAAQIAQQKLRENTMASAKEPFLARFLIYTNGTKRIFSTRKYYLQWPDAFLRSDGPTIVHVATKGTTWGNFFHSLPLTLTQQCLVISQLQQFCTDSENSLKFYLNGKKISEFLTLEIHDGDRALISYGAENNVDIQDQLAAVEKLP